MSNLSLKSTLEDEYINKWIKKFEWIDDYLIEKIQETIKVVSFQVDCTLNSIVSKEEQDDTLSDLSDFIPTNLANNIAFVDIVNEFIFKKVDSIKNNKEKNIDTKNIVTIPPLKDRINKIYYYLNLIKEDISLIEEFIADITWMREHLCLSTLNVAKRHLYDIDRWLEKNVVKINLAIKSISYLLIWIEQEWWKSILPNADKWKIYNIDWWFLSDDYTEKIKVLLVEFERETENYDKHIKHVLEQKMLDEEINDEIEWEDIISLRETDIGFQIIELYPSIKATSLMNSIEFIINTIKDVIESDIEHIEKMKRFENPLNWFDLTVFEWNSEALELLNELVWISIEEYIISSDKEITMSHTIPKSCHIDVMKQLHVIINKTLWEKVKDDVKKTIVKKKSDKFIYELNKIILDLYTLISENWNYSYFKNTRIKWILKSLDIEEEMHDEYFKIVDLYYKDRRSTFNSDSEKRKRPISILEEAYIDLEETLKEIPLKKLLIVEKFIKYVQINLPTKIYQDIIDNITEEKNKSTVNTWVRWVIKKMDERWKAWQNSTSNAYDTIFNTSEKRISEKESKTLIWITKTKEYLKQKRIEEVISSFFIAFPHITRDIQEKLKPFLRNLYVYETQRALKNYNMATDVFQRIKQ